MKITREFEQFIEDQGWTIVCESPLELSHEDGSFASMQAAKLALSQLNEEFLDENPSYREVPEDNSLDDQESKIAELVRINNKVQSYVEKAQAQKELDEETNNNGGYSYEAEKLWDLTYSLVFSENISRRTRALFNELNINFDYYDPDTSYEEDVRAYADALNEKVSSIKTLIDDEDNTNRPKRRY